jgi:hypothetical protein
MNRPETCFLRLPTDLKRRLERAANKEGLSLNQWAVYNLSQSVAFTEAYRELEERLRGADLARAKETAWRLLHRRTPRAPRPPWGVVPRGWRNFERDLALGIPNEPAIRKRAGRPRLRLGRR